MANVLSQIKLKSANLDDADQKMVLAQINRFLQGGADDNNNDDEPATEKRKPGRPKKIANSASSKTAKTTTAKRGVGRPRKTDDEDEELTKPRRSAKAETNAKKPAAKKPVAKTEIDFSDLDKQGARELAETWKVNNAKLLKNSAALLRALQGINKIATNDNRDVSYVEKMAKKAGVELKFGQGRPPTDEMGLKRRILVKMVNEGAYAG
jgi:hypothetical protein